MALMNCPECNKQISYKAEICVGCGAPVEVNPKFIIGIPITIGNLEVAQYDYPKVMDQVSARVACPQLGNGWRLPEKDELNILYKNKDKIGGFTDYSYWSKTTYNFGNAWRQSFEEGLMLWNDMNEAYYVRAVRTF